VSTAHFEVLATLDRAGAAVKGTVSIDRETGMISVRPRGSRRTYDMPLSTVATLICKAIIIDDVKQKKIARKAKRRGSGC
jgi:hypothetical protein